MKIAIDSDMLLFRAMSATEVEVELEPEVWVRHSELPQAREMYWEQCEAWCELFDCKLDDLLHCFTDRSNFRKEVDPGYKANRKSKPKPMGFKALKSQFLEESGAWLHRQIEADDLLGIFATMPDLKEEGVVIATLDKDLKQIPGIHVWVDNEPYEVTADDAERFTYQQYLTGDATDGVPGCPGVGPVTAERIVQELDLTQPVDCWEAIVRAYEKAQRKKDVDLYDAHEYALRQARLVRILRYGEYNFTTHEVKLWNHPTR